MSANTLIVAAIIRRGEEILLIKQQGPDDPLPYWALPGGRVEEGELLTEALAREVREETGLVVTTPGRLIYAAQSHNPNESVLFRGELPGPGDTATTFVFEINEWDGVLGWADPDNLILDARHFAVAEAVSELERIPFRIMREPVLAYLQGEATPGAMWFYRREPDGGDNLIGRVG
jgi:8-oxo-dGTP diphosphatase